LIGLLDSMTKGGELGSLDRPNCVEGGKLKPAGAHKEERNEIPLAKFALSTID